MQKIKGGILNSQIECLESQIRNRLRRHLRSLGFRKKRDGCLVIPDSTKDGFRHLHSEQRKERLVSAKAFLERRLPNLLDYFASGNEIDPEKISPRIELVVSGTYQADLFRLASLTWSVPVSRGYGRRMRFLVWDDNNEKLIGIFALGDPVFNLKIRDSMIGWNQALRRERLVNLMDAFVLGALPPYNRLLCGKLVASLIRTREVKNEFASRYRHSKGIISKKAKKPNLVLVTTSSALGRSSIYNRLKIGGMLYFRNIGYTSGWGHFHIPDELFKKMREYLAQVNHDYAANHSFGQGPNWRLRAVRQTLKLIGENPDLLQHNIKREVFVCELAKNAVQFLQGKVKRPDYRGLLSVKQVSELAKERWIVPRSTRIDDYRGWVKSDISDLLVP